MEPSSNPYLVDPDSLTLGEMVVFEGVTGWTTGEILAAFEGGSGVQSPKFLLALQSVVGARGADSYQLEDAMAVRLVDVLGVISSG